MCRRFIKRSRTYPPTSESDHFARPIGTIGLSSETRRGFAITNLQAGDEDELSLAFLSLGGPTQAVGLFNDDDHTAQSSYYNPVDIRPTAVIVPLPPPVGLALVGLIGVVWLRRRMTS